MAHGRPVTAAVSATQSFSRVAVACRLVVTEINPDPDPDGTVIRDFVARLRAAF